MLARFAFAAALAGVLAAPAAAQDDLETPAFAGLAVSQAPEAGLGVCFGVDAAGTMECAQHECMELSGLGPQDCAVNLWCYPHGWAADIFMQHAEGPHWHKFLCDQPSREKLEAAIALECNEDYLIECSAVRIWDHEGKEVLGLVTEQPAP